MRAKVYGLLVVAATSYAPNDAGTATRGALLAAKESELESLDDEEHRMFADAVDEHTAAVRFRKVGQPVALVHIPKAGGTSLLALMNKSASISDFGGNGWFDPDFTGKWEQCFSHVRTKDNFVVSMVRSPRAHVLSQFLECRYDTWGKQATEYKNFPRAASEQEDFVSWLSTFTSEWKNETGDYGCYNPWNMQARALLCHEPQWFPPPLSKGTDPCDLKPMSMVSSVHHLWSDGIKDREPSFVNSVTAMNELAFVGVVELYEESWCLMEYQLTGQLPDACSCERYHELVIPKETHNVPADHMRVEDQPASVIQAVDSLTHADSQLYHHAVSRLLTTLAVAQKATGRHLFCSQRIRRQLEKTEIGLHVFRSMSMIDTAQFSPVGSGRDHYSHLSRWVQSIFKPSAVVPFDLTTTTAFGNVREPDYDAMLALDPDRTTSTGRAALIPFVRQLHERNRNLKAIVWPAVELRMYSEAHAATTMTKAHGNCTVPAYPTTWFNALNSTTQGPIEEAGIRPMPHHAANKFTVITFETLFHHSAPHCFILRNDGHQNRSIAVPYPTSFHAASDEAFERHVKTVRKDERHHLAVMYASSHNKGLDGPELRMALNEQCTSSKRCRNLLDLVHQHPDGTNATMNLSNLDVHGELRRATFCLEPQGDTPTRSQIFECLMTGTIPVFFSSCARPDLVYERMYEPFLPRYDRSSFGAGDWAVVLDSSRVMNEPGYMEDELSRLARDKIKVHTMRRNIVAIMPQLQYPRHRGKTLSKYQPDALEVLRTVLSQRGLSDTLRPAH
mmetsp:Transcript_14902/g.38459  ORF Transcript_14902/g.38459 Transcript_14902/m.38459 type:complete len:788 (-) Transcript_14902:128-2491(-)